MNRNLIAVTLFAAGLVLVNPVAAQSSGKPAGGKKLYRWVDKDGKVHFSDALPAEVVDQARQEFSAQTGQTVGSVDRALTAEERAAQEAAALSAAEIAAREAETKRQEAALLGSYETEADLDRAFAERVDLLKRTIEGIEVSIEGQRASLLTHLGNASDMELAGRPVDDKRATTIQDLHQELVNQQNLLTKRQVELGALGLEQARTLARYREMREEQAKKAAEAAGG